MELGVLAAHQLRNPLRIPGEKPGLQLERATLEDRPPHDPAQYVAPVLVGGDHPVCHQERHGSPVVGEYAQGLIHGELAPVGPARQLLAQCNQRRELVGLEHRGLALEHGGKAVQAEAGVDVVCGQRPERAVRSQVELCEHQVPVLQEALVLAARQVLWLAKLHAAVEVQLRAWPARTRRAHLPEVLRARAFDDPLARNPDLQPGLDRLLVGPQPQLLVAPEHGYPDVLEREPESINGELERVAHGLPLEVVAEREVAEHLEEREMPGGRPDDVDVRGAEGLLAGSDSRVWRALLAEEVGLQRMHARNREQHRGVMLGRDQ